MKRPDHQDESGRGEQLVLIPAAEFSPLWPNPSSLAAVALEQFMKGRALTHDAFIGLTGSWRLSAYVKDLHDKGWPIVADKLAAPLESKAHRAIAVYYLPQRYIVAALELRQQG